MTIDIGNFYTNTPLDRYEYMRMRADEIPDEVMDEYDLKPKIHDGYIYFRIKKALYGLRQSSILAHKMLAKILNKDSRYPVKHMKEFWLHKTKDILFTIIVDDFEIFYLERKDVEE